MKLTPESSPDDASPGKNDENMTPTELDTDPPS
jgi:hypothetical protein